MSWTKKNIVVPIDLSDESFAALDEALQIAGDAKFVRIVHVLVNVYPDEPGMILGAIDKAERIGHARQAIAQRLSEKKYHGVAVHVLMGDAGHEITEFASEIGADLIVMPSHGRTGLKRVMLGSVAERVVRLATCPVLIIRRAA